jgi:hypothetical protein
VAQDFLANLQPPSTTSNDHGDFLLWLDPEVLGNQARYDLQITPPPGTVAPPWTKELVDVEAVHPPRTPTAWRDPTAPRDPCPRHRGDQRGRADRRRHPVGARCAPTTPLCANAIRPLGDICVPPSSRRPVGQQG